MANVLDRFTVRLYYGDEADEKVGKYLARFESAAHGVKHARAKELLHRGLQAQQGELEGSTPDLNEIRRVIREELSLHDLLLDKEGIAGAVAEALQSPDDGENTVGDSGFTLSDVREVVASVVATELDRREICSGQKETGDDGKADEEIGRMSSGLLIE